MKMAWLGPAALIPLLASTPCDGGGDGELPEGACQSSEDCEGGQFCVPPGESPGCGICFQPEQQCGEDRDCGSGFVCQEYQVQCSCGGSEFLCMPSCTADTQCGEGQVCDEGSGHCVTYTCGMGKACEELTTCVPGSGGDDCVRWSCSYDGDCGDGNACVEGQCYTDYGFCSYPPAREAH